MTSSCIISQWSRVVIFNIKAIEVVTIVGDKLLTSLGEDATMYPYLSKSGIWLILSFDSNYGSTVEWYITLGGARVRSDKGFVSISTGNLSSINITIMIMILILMESIMMTDDTIAKQQLMWNLSWFQMNK